MHDAPAGASQVHPPVREHGEGGGDYARQRAEHEEPRRAQNPAGCATRRALAAARAPEPPTVSSRQQGGREHRAEDAHETQEEVACQVGEQRVAGPAARAARQRARGDHGHHHGVDGKQRQDDQHGGQELEQRALGDLETDRPLEQVALERPAEEATMAHAAEPRADQEPHRLGRRHLALGERCPVRLVEMDVARLAGRRGHAQLGARQLALAQPHDAHGDGWRGPARPGLGCP